MISFGIFDRQALYKYTCIIYLSVYMGCRRAIHLLHKVWSAVDLHQCYTLRVTGMMAQPTPTTTLMGKLFFTGRNFNAFCNKISLLVRFYLCLSCLLTLPLVQVVDAASAAAPDISFRFFLTLPDIVRKRIIYGLS